ncbi:MAG: transposon-transfer assisting family protein [Lachnospiraceae bacterium]|nr:transposon-transfer assisting family protein [Lachnospiraceae bacterium]
MNFTEEERILLMIYNPGTRLGLMETLREMRGELTESERQLRSLTDAVLGKLAQMSEEDFEVLSLYPDLKL